MQTVVVVEPEQEPVTVEEAKRHARMHLDLTDDDPMIAGYIRAARLNLEKRLGRAFVTQTLETTWGYSGQNLRLPRAPVQSIVAVEYQDRYGDSRPIDPESRLSREGTPGWVIPTSAWAVGSDGRVLVRYVAGYGDPDAVPEEAKLAIKMLVSHWYERREPVAATPAVAKIPFHIDALLDSLRWGNYPQ